MKYPDGSSYRGDWQNNQRHGNGEMVYANGDRYVGQWADNVRQGNGSYIYAASHTMCTGRFERGSLVGEAKWSYVAEHSSVEEIAPEPVGFPEDRPAPAEADEDAEEAANDEEPATPPTPKVHVSFVPFVCSVKSSSAPNSSKKQANKSSGLAVTGYESSAV